VWAVSRFFLMLNSVLHMTTTGLFRVKIVLYKGATGRDHPWTSSPTLCANTDVNIRASTIPHPFTSLIWHTTLFNGSLHVSKETTNSRWPRLAFFTLPVYLSKIQDNYWAILVERRRFLDLLMTTFTWTNIPGSFLRMWIDVFRTVNIQWTAFCIILWKSQATLRAPYKARTK
jgi:hypothetical protein